MRSKRYFAQDFRSAVLKVKQELGSNAVILAHQRIKSGIEVTAISGNTQSEHYRAFSNDQVGDETLGVKNVRDSFESSRQESIEYFSADKDFTEENSTRAGNRKMHDKTANKFQGKDCADSNSESADNTEYDFEAEMNMILDSRPPTPLIGQPPEELTNPDTFGSETPSKQTVIKSSKSSSSHASVPPIIDGHYDYERLVEAVEQSVGETAFGEAAKKNPAKAALIKQLMKLDISPLIIQSVADALVSDKINQKMLFPQAMALLANQIPIYKEDVTAIGGTVALFGATGVGKTTTIAKLAARYALRHGADKVALITTDDNRIAATEQLRTYSNILGMPLRIARDDVEVLNALNTFSEKEFVLIDTAGMTPYEISSSKYYDLFSGGITQIKKFMVLPATMHREALEQSTQAFSELNPDGSIITKVDETTSLGGAISVAIQNNLPVAFYGDGQTVPDDFHLARAHILMSRVADVAQHLNEQAADTQTDNYTPGIIGNARI